MKKFFVAVSLFAIACFPFIASAQTQISLSFPGTQYSNTTNPGQVINSFYNFALLIAGILAFGAIVFGGIKYMTSSGNPSSQHEAKEWIWSSLLGILLLAGAYLILHTINPALVNLSLSPLQNINVNTSSTYNSSSTTGLLCDDPPALAAANHEPYPAQTSAEISSLLSCLHQHVSFSAPQFTYDQSHPLCNYSRGTTQCGACSHARNSCHYGGRSGTSGALAVDIDVVGSLGDQVINAAYAYCGIPRGGYPKARCEAASGVMVPCSGGATHVHISAASCDAN